MINNIFNNPELYYSNENENIRKNGERVWIAWRNTPIYDSSGDLKEYLCIGNNITVQKDAENRLKDNFSAALSILNAIQGKIIHIDSDGTILRMNKQAIQESGINGNEITGGNIFDLYPGSVTRVLHEKILDAIENKETVTYETIQDDRYYQISIYPHPDETHKIKFLTLHFVDISDKKELQEKCRQIQIKAEFYSENNRNPFFIQDDKLRYTWIENSRGHFPDSSMTGLKDIDIMDESSAKKLSRIKRRILKNQTPEEIQLPVKLNKKTTNLLYKLSPVVEANGISSGLCGTVSDLSDENKFLKQEENSLGNILSNTNRPVLITDRNGTIKVANPESHVYFGYDQDKLKSKKIYELVPSKASSLCKKSIADLFESGDDQETIYDMSGRTVRARYSPVFMNKEISHAVIIIDEKDYGIY